MTHEMDAEFIEHFGGYQEGLLAILLYPEFTALDVFWATSHVHQFDG
ncbi:hypothetical protein [Candidatus Flexifilum breve]